MSQLLGHSWPGCTGGSSCMEGKAMFHSHMSWALKVGDGQPRQGPARTEIRPHEAHGDGDC